MKAFRFSFLAVLLLFFSPLRAIDVSITSCVFYNTDQAYIEIYSRILGETVQFASHSEKDFQLHSRIEMLVIFRKDDDIVLADKYSIGSPPMVKPADFWDMKRFALDPGDYTIEYRYVDLNRPTDTIFYDQRLSVEAPGGYKHSDILLMAEASDSGEKLKFPKAGFYFEPLAFNLAGPARNSMLFYNELYNVGQLCITDCFLKYYTESVDEPGTFAGKAGYKKLSGKAVESFLLPVDLSEFTSGNYILKVEIFSREKQLLDSYSKKFSVYHPLVDMKQSLEKDEIFDSSFVQLLDEDELDYALKAIFPLVGNKMTESLNLIIAGNEILTKRYFLYNFWNRFAPSAPRAAYESYLDVARAVDLEFSNNVGHGFETDRGYYFLKYGRPDDIVHVEDEPSAPPYEIWIYNYMEATQQTNVKFLFYNPSLAGNDFKLLHSTCRGELNNPNWEFDLYRDSFDNYDQDGFNKNAKRYFSDF